MDTHEAEQIKRSFSSESSGKVSKIGILAHLDTQTRFQKSLDTVQMMMIVNKKKKNRNVVPFLSNRLLLLKCLRSYLSHLPLYDAANVFYE